MQIRTKQLINIIIMQNEFRKKNANEDCVRQKPKKTIKISEMKNKNSPSTTNTCDAHDGGRSGSKKTTTAVADPNQEILQAVNDMLALT